MPLHQKRIGVLLRCFTPIERDQKIFEKSIHETLESIRRLQSLRVGGQEFISHIEILIPTDNAYAQKDCGLTARRLRIDIHKEGFRNVSITEVEEGDIYVTVLNYGIACLLRAQCDYGLIFSKEARGYLTQESIEDLVEAINKGALCAGIALTELTESVMRGRIVNTFAIWHLMSLVQVGCFDERNVEQRKYAPRIHLLEAWDEVTGFWNYNLVGVEEIIPMIRLVRRFGPCLAPIIPRGNGIGALEVPDPAHDPLGYARHIRKMRTRFVRQNHCAALEHADLSVLEGGILPAYRSSETQA